MAKQTPIDIAFKRCRLLAAIVDREYDRALADPTAERYETLDVTAKGDKKAVAEEKIRESFTQLQDLVRHLTILDMVASFELSFNQRITTAIGSARSALKAKHSNQALASREKLIRNADEFRGLAKISDLFESDLDALVKDTIEDIRTNRNNFAHGTNLTQPPTIDKDLALEALNKVFELLKPI